MEEAIISVLVAAGFQRKEIVLDLADGGRVGGFLVSDRFRGQPQIDRQNWLWKLLEEKLAPADLARVVAILTMTPGEAEMDVDAGSESTTAAQ